MKLAGTLAKLVIGGYLGLGTTSALIVSLKYVNIGVGSETLLLAQGGAIGALSGLLLIKPSSGFLGYVVDLIGSEENYYNNLENNN